ncbi:MarR family transcriptional regulator [Bacillus sp. E(2018)]|uniref:MarR family winged helix-turn-helix transcriptional regulator n=1 Tax=Bacillus sp. E(2018) TaxID=2502239 RepID=UPI00148511FB|nr:MarR family transcriptional regulator [Bacillus sp. E(2018)]
MKKESIELTSLYRLVDYIRSNITEGETLGFKQIDLLLVLLLHKNLSITEIAYQMDITPPSVSALTDKLIKKDLISRTYNQLDRRVVIINLKEEGKVLAQALKDKQDSIISFLEESLTTEEKHTLNTLIRKLNSH